MTITAFPIHISSFSNLPESDMYVLEVRSFEWVEYYKKTFSFLPEHFFQKIEENITSQKEKTLEWYPDTLTRKILFFFPSKEEVIMDARSSFFRDRRNDSFVFIPDGDISEAFEAMSLSVYQFHFYKTKPKKSEKYFIIPDDYPKKNLEEKIPLYMAIYHARDIVNMPAQDLYPKSFIEQILVKKWRHFDVRVFSEKELREIGCNLLLAV